MSKIKWNNVALVIVILGVVTLQGMVLSANASNRELQTQVKHLNERVDELKHLPDEVMDLRLENERLKTENELLHKTIDGY